MAVHNGRVHFDVGKSWNFMMWASSIFDFSYSLRRVFYFIFWHLCAYQICYTHIYDCLVLKCIYCMKGNNYLNKIVDIISASRMKYHWIVSLPACHPRVDKKTKLNNTKCVIFASWVKNFDIHFIYFVFLLGVEKWIFMDVIFKFCPPPHFYKVFLIW